MNLHSKSPACQHSLYGGGLRNSLQSIKPYGLHRCRSDTNVQRLPALRFQVFLFLFTHPGKLWIWFPDRRRIFGLHRRHRCSIRCSTCRPLMLRPVDCSEILWFMFRVGYVNGIIKCRRFNRQFHIVISRNCHNMKATKRFSDPGTAALISTIYARVPINRKNCEHIRSLIRRPGRVQVKRQTEKKHDQSLPFECE